MTRYALEERRALCETFLRTGPDAATLCEGWTTRDLATHLLLRERRPDAQLGRVLPVLAGHAASVEHDVRGTAWPELVGILRSGPPAWSPSRLPAVDELVNTVEMFVHHEDVLRAQPGWTARPLPKGLQQALWRNLRVLGRLTLRRVPVGVELVAPGLGRLPVHAGSPVVRVEGPPAEVLLFVAGRRDHARVDLAGPNPAVGQLRASPLGV